MSVIFPFHKRIELAAVKPYATNARTHSQAQIAQIAASIREFGWTNPLLLDEHDNLIAGHGRVSAASSIGLLEAPALVIEGLSDTQKAALRLADNKLALNAGWDDALLRGELEGLQLAGFDLALTGFADDELRDIFADRTAGLTDPDDVPEVVEAITQPGDVWMLGRHRLVCGDATSEIDVSLCLAGVRPHLMVTDPPYGVDYDPNWRNDALQAGVGARGAPGGRAIGVVTNDERADWADAWTLSPSEVAYVWHGALHTSEVLDSLRSAQYEARSL